MFEITIPLPNIDMAFSHLKSTIYKLDWYINNNRSNRLEYYQKLNNPLINQMIEDRGLPSSTFKEKYFSRYQNELYHQEQYLPLIQKVQSILPIVQSCFDEMQQLKNHWGFEILPAYQIDIASYCVGGKYYRDGQNIGHIVLGFANQWEDSSALAHIIVHEMVHLGIEDLIINPNHLKNPPIHQEEKERIVDNLCIYVTKKHIPHYQREWKDGSFSRFQEITTPYAYMDKVVGYQPDNNLFQSVKQFLKEQGRV